MLSPLRQRDGALDDVFKFANIAGPGVRQQLIQRCRRDGANVLAQCSAANRFRKCPASSAMSSRPLAQWRQDNLHGVDPVIQIVPEFFRRDRFWNVGVRGAEQPHVRLGFPACRPAVENVRPATRAAAWPAIAGSFPRSHPAGACRRRPAQTCRVWRRRRR